MTNKNLKKKIISGVILGSIIASLGVGVFASELNQTETEQTVSSSRNCEMNNKGNKKNQHRMHQTLKESGIFTESETEEIKTYLESRKAEMNKDRESLKYKTEEERETYREENRVNKEKIMNELVTNGTITQAQLDQLKKTMPQDKLLGRNKRHGRCHKKGHKQDQLDQLKEKMPQKNQLKNK